jgi:hypothetical protein
VVFDAVGVLVESTGVLVALGAGVFVRVGEAIGVAVLVALGAGV